MVSEVRNRQTSMISTVEQEVADDMKLRGIYHPKHQNMSLTTVKGRLCRIHIVSRSPRLKEMKGHFYFTSRKLSNSGSVVSYDRLSNCLSASKIWSESTSESRETNAGSAAYRHLR